MASPSIEVRYEDLSVSTTALVGDKQIPTVVRSVKGVFKVGAGSGCGWVLRRLPLVVAALVGVCGGATSGLLLWCTASWGPARWSWVVQRSRGCGRACGRCLPLGLPQPTATTPCPCAQSLAGGGGGQRPLSIIKGASGVLRPGRFTLVLAPPGSGKTTLLRALSGRLREQKDLQVLGVGGWGVGGGGGGGRPVVSHGLHSWLTSWASHVAICAADLRQDPVQRPLL